MKRERVLVQVSVFVLAMLITSCHTIHKVKLVKNENSKKGNTIFDITYLSTIKRSFNQKDFERKYYVHAGDSVYQLKNVIFDPLNPDSIPTRKSSVKWYRENQKVLKLIAEIDSLDKESYTLYEEKLVANRPRFLGKKSEKGYADQTHLFVDSLSMNSNALTIHENSIQKAELTVMRNGRELLVLASILAGIAIVIGLFMLMIVAVIDSF